MTQYCIVSLCSVCMFTGVYTYTTVYDAQSYAHYYHVRYIICIYVYYMLIIYVHCTYSNMISYDTVRIFYSMILIECIYTWHGYDMHSVSVHSGLALSLPLQHIKRNIAYCGPLKNNMNDNLNDMDCVVLMGGYCNTVVSVHTHTPTSWKMSCFPV